MQNKVTIYLMSLKGLEALKAVINKFGSDTIDFIVTSKEFGNVKDYYPEIIRTCKQFNIKYYDKKEDFTVQTKYSIAIAWRWLIKQDESTLIVLHDSLLPAYRGFAPLVNAIVNGEKRIGVTAIVATEEYDKGGIISQSQIDVEYPLKIMKAIELMAICYSKVVCDIIEIILKNENITTIPQDETKSSYSVWLDDLDYSINWNWSAEYIKRFIDSVGFPYSGATSKLNEDHTRISDADVMPDVEVIDRDRHIGKVLYNHGKFPVIICKKGLLRINKMENNKGETYDFPLKKFRTRFS